MGRFHLPCAIIIYVQESLKNPLILESLHHFVNNVNMDIFINKHVANFTQKNIKFFNEDIQKYPPFISKTYKYFIFFPFYNFTIIHTHLPQFLFHLNLKKKISHIQFQYLIYQHHRDFLKEKYETFHITNDKELVDDSILFKNHKLLSIDTSNFGLIKHDSESYKVNDIFLSFYKTFIYKCSFYVLKPEFIINHFSENKPFTFLRIGDGEMHCIHTQKSNYSSNYNKNGCDFEIVGLADSILEILNDDFLIDKKNIYVAWNPSVIRNRYDCFLTFNKYFNNYNMSFLIDHTILIKKLIQDAPYFSSFIKSIHLHSNYIIYVGPDYMDSNLNPIRYDKFITIPNKNCFEKKNVILDQIIDSLHHKTIVFFSGGLGIKYVIYKLFLKYGNTHTFFDLGSVLDPFFNIWSRRTYIHNKNNIVQNINIILNK